MATQEQSIRVSAKGEFGQLQRGLKDLQGDLKNVMGTIDKGARKGGIFDDTSFRALDTFKQRFNGTMKELNEQFDRQNAIIDNLTDKMKSANVVDKIGIQDTIKAREKELDVIRRQILEVERLYKKRTTEASNYEIKVPGSSSQSSGSTGSGANLASSAITSFLGKVGGAIGTVAKLTLGLAGISSLMSMAQDAYQIAYQRQVGSLDLAQRLRGHGYTGQASDMYNFAADIGRRDKMGYSEQESWALLDAYSSRGGAVTSADQYIMQKFARGYGLDASQVGSTIGGVKQLGGVTKPKEFADMIAASVSQSGMLPRIMEVMQAHTALLSSINTTFKDGSSSQILAYQTTLDRLGTANGMTKLTGQQGASVINGLNGIYQPNNDKWLWMGISALQSYNPGKYGKQGLYSLEENFEDGLQNPDNLPAMAQYLKRESGGNTNLFKRLMQTWLQDGGFNATKRQVDELDKVTNGFSVFNSDKVQAVMSSMQNGDAGTKYDSERKNEKGQSMLDTQARFDKSLGDLGERYLLPIVNDLKEGFTGLLEQLDKSKATLDNILLGVAGIAAAVVAGKLIGGVGSLISKFRGGGKGGAGKLTEEIAEDVKGASGKSGESKLGRYLKSGELTSAELTELEKLSGGSKPLKNQLEQIYRSTGDMDAVKHAVSGKASPSDIIDMLSNGDSKTQAMLTKHYESTGSMASTMEKAKALSSQAEKLAAAENGFASRFFGGTSPATSFGKKLLGGGSILGGALEFGTSLYDGDNVGKAGSKAGGMMVGTVAGGMSGQAIGALLGGAIGALFGGAGAVPGAAIGGAIGEFAGSIGGGYFGSQVGSTAYDAYNDSTATGKAASSIVDFADRGTLSIDGLSQEGVRKLQELKDEGLLNYIEMNTSTTANVASMSEQGKQDLLKLQQDGLIAIGGLQENGSVKITALSDQGTTALHNLQEAGLVSITDFQKTGKLQITSLSKEGAASLLDLQKSGSLSLTSMDINTLGKLKDIRKDTSDSMNDIIKEHKGMSKTIGDFLDKLWINIKGFLGIEDKGSKEDSSGGLKWYDGSGKATSGEYTGKYADWINKAAEKYGFDPFLIAGIIQTESSFNPNDVNPDSGATGLGQFLKSTADDIGLSDRTDPESSIDAIGKYLSMRRDWAGGDINKAIMGYGEGTQVYLDKVLKNTELMKQQYGGGTGDSSLGNTSYGTPGGSIFQNWQNHINSGFGVNRGDHYHGGIDLAARQGTEIDALANGYVSFINMDDGGQYDPDGTANTRAGGTEVGVTTSDGNTYYFAHMSSVADDILAQFEAGNKVNIAAGQYVGTSGGTPGVAGSGYSTTGNHLHFGYLDGAGNAIDPAVLLNSLNIGDATDIGKFTDVSLASMQDSAAATRNVHVTVDVNLKGDGNAVSQLNIATVSQLKGLIQQAIQAYEAQKLAMYPTARG